MGQAASTAAAASLSFCPPPAPSSHRLVQQSTARAPGARRRPARPVGRGRETPRQASGTLGHLPPLLLAFDGSLLLDVSWQGLLFSPFRGKRKKPSFLIQLSRTVGRGRLARLLGGGLQNSEGGKQTLPH